MRRILVLCIACLFIGVAAAQSSGLDRGAGVLGPDSPLYGLEKAWDNAAISMGLKKAGDVAQERAAEAREMLEKGDPEAASRATDDLENIVKKASPEDQEGITKAKNALQQAMNDMQQRMQDASNEQAREGMQKAMDNMQGALGKMDDAWQRAQNAMGSGGTE